MGDYSKYEENHLDVEMKGRVAVVTMNRPEKRNAIDSALHEGLELILEDLSTDPDIGAIVLTGAGKAFCAGGDISTMGDTIQDRSPLHYTRGPKYLIQAFANCEAPIIAAVNGPAAGLGATIALMCDVIYMSDQARIGDTHVQVGLVAGDGGAVIWPLLVGPHRAKEFLMAGAYVDGAKGGEDRPGEPRGAARPTTGRGLGLRHGAGERARGGGPLDQDGGQPDDLAEHQPGARDEPRHGRAVLPDEGPRRGGDGVYGEASAQVHRRVAGRRGRIRRAS